MKVGILALQGDFSAHAQALTARGVSTVEVRRPEHLSDLSGLVLPGGESTTMLKLMESGGLRQEIVAKATSGLPMFATCAGVILIAREVVSPRQDSLGILDVSVERNAYGRQLDSTVVNIAPVLPSDLGVESLEGVFIRAPRIIRTGDGVKVLARRGNDAVLVQQHNILAATFHPELSQGSPVVSLFLQFCVSRSR